MYTCKKCGQQYPQYIRFCGKCGGEVVDNGLNQQNFQNQGYQYEQTMQTSALAYSTEPNPMYQPASPVAPAPEPSGAARTKGIIGMILGIESIIGSLVCFILGCVAIGVSADAVDSYGYYGYYYGYYDYRAEAESFAIGVIVFMFIQLALAIVGMCLSNSSRSGGFVTGISKTGKVLSLIALILTAISTVFGFIACGIVA